MNRNKQYLENQIMNATREQLLIMMYNRAILEGNKVLKIGYDYNNFDKRNVSLTRMEDIIRELDKSLVGEGDEIDALSSLYNWFVVSIINMKKDSNNKNLFDIIEMLKELRNAWKGECLEEKYI